MAADGAAALAAARVDRAGVIAVINVQPAVAAADAARRTGIDRRDRAGVVAVDDRALAPARADDAADALGVRIFDGGVIRAVLQIDARGDAAGAADDAADHAAAVDAAADGEIAHGWGRFRCGLAVIEVAHVADEADALRIGIALFGIAVAEQVRDAVALPVERAVEICHDHTLRVVTVHRIQAADRRPVARAAHVEVGRQADGLVREIMCGIADIGRAVLAAAARADEQIVVDPRGDELAAVALDAVVRRARVDLPVDEGRKARELCGRVEIKRRLRCIIPRDVDRAVPDRGGKILRPHGVGPGGTVKGIGIAGRRLLDRSKEVAPVGQLTAHRRKVIARAALQRSGHPLRSSCAGHEAQQQAKGKDPAEKSFHSMSSVTIRLRTVPRSVGTSARMA